MQDTASKRKRSVNLSVDGALLQEARSAGVNLSAAFDEALRSKLSEHRIAKWREENRAAIEASRRELEENGLWADDYRVW